MKGRAMLLTILITTALIATGCSAPQAMAQNLVESTQRIVSEVRSQNDSVFEEIQQNVDAVDRLRDRIETSEESGSLLEEVISELRRVTLSYEDLASRREEIRRTLMAKITALEDLQKKVQTESTALAERREEYSEMLRTFNDPDPEIVRTRGAALKQAITYIDMQRQLWSEFLITEQQIRDETLIVQQRINSFLSVIESSAILFREGLNLLILQRDINDAISLFSHDLPRMEQLSRDMEQSWSHLDMLVNTLASISIDLDNS